MRFDIFQLTLRQLLGFHRFGFFILVLFIIGLPVFAAGAASAVEAAATSSNFNPEEFLAGLFQGSQLPIFYPIVILFLASIALREEIDNNTIVYLWTKPISRASIEPSTVRCPWTSTHAPTSNGPCSISNSVDPSAMTT